MSRDKQIEEMAKATCKSRFKQDEPLCKKCTEKCIYREIAKLMSDAGYRKADEVAREIFEEIEEYILLEWNEEAYAKLKKKYTEGGE